MQELQFRSPRSVTQLFEALERSGYVQRLKGARNVRILREPPTAHPERAETVAVPVIGRVAAGLPILAEENIESVIQVSKAIARGSARYFALRVVGDSMDNAGIREDDLVVVRQQPSAIAGDKVVALIDDEATVKVYRPAGDAVVLEPRSTNPKHRPIVVERELVIQGVVVATVPADSGEGAS